LEIPLDRDRRIQIIASLILALCLASSGVLAVAMTGVAGRARMTYTDRAELGQPWEVSAGIAMGAFRGVFVNFLWLRANEMKEAGKFYEAIGLADAITRLQPRFPRVWVFHAWNMSYNISVATQTASERWKWVSAGIELLRDKGIPANPNDMLLHKELGWIFLHKIGGYTDDANPFYKRRLAVEWTAVLGPPPPRTSEDRNRAHAVAKHAAWLSVIADAPDTLEGVVKAQPVAGVLADRLRSETGIDLTGDPALLRDALLGPYEMVRAADLSVRKVPFREALADRPRVRALAGLMDDPAMAPAWPPLLAHVRKRVLIDAYRMEPARMVRYTQKFGPIDWRHHGAHSLYWAQKGVEAGEARFTKEARKDFDFLNTDRIVAQSVQELFRTGEMYFDFLGAVTGQEYVLLQGVPNPHFIEPYGQIIAEQRGRSWADRVDARGSTPLSAGYENFLRDAVLFFYRRGERDRAEALQTELRTWQYKNLGDEYREEEFELPLDEFVANELKDASTRPSIAVSQISGSIMGAYASGLLGNDDDLFRSQLEYGKRFHRYFMEAQLRNTSVDRNTGRMEQVDRDYEVVAGTLFFQFMSGLGIDEAEQAYDNAPPDLRRWAYDPLKGRYEAELNALAAKGGRTFAQVFPEPDGMAQFRAESEERVRSRSLEGPTLEQR